MYKHLILIIALLAFSGCLNIDKVRESGSEASSVEITPSSPVPIETVPVEHDPVETIATATNMSSISVINATAGSSVKENRSIAVEVDYRKYVDWFTNHNLNIRAYTPQEYVCGQYTVDMINDSSKEGFNAYFAVVSFSDGSGHALVSFKSTRFGISSWYFFEPQNNHQMTPETLGKVLNENMGKKVTEVNIYGYFDDAGDKDPATWRFAYPLYTKKY